MIPNGPELAVCFLSMSLFCSYAPLNSNLTEVELEFELVDIPAKAIVGEREPLHVAFFSGARLTGLAVTIVSQSVAYRAL